MAGAAGEAVRAGAAGPGAYAFGPFRLVPGERILSRGDRVLPLPPKAFETLLLLVRNSGHLMRKADLMTALWPDSFVGEVSLAGTISLLRKVLKEGGAAGGCIQTVARLGYRFVAPVTAVWAPDLPAEPVIRFIALPFRIRNGDQPIAFLGRSLPEAVSASLAGLRSLTVRSSLLAARLAQGQPDPRQIAEEAGVDMLLTGAILCDGVELRVTAELVHAPTGTLVGSYVCQTGHDNLIDVQEGLVRGIVELLTLRLTERERRALAHDVPASPRAYEFYLRANHVQQERTLANVSMARDLYRACLDEDPDYAPAWARVGRCYRFLEKFGEPGSQRLELAEWAFRRAFALSPDLPVAHNLYTPIEADSGHAREAMVRVLGCVEHHPNDPELFGGLVQACRYCGLLEESVRAHHRARRLDPEIATSVAHTFFLMGDYQRALDWCPPGALFCLDLAVLAATGREAEAATLLGQRRSPGGQFQGLMESLRLTLQGDHAESLDVVRRTLGFGPASDPEIKFYLARQLARNGAHADALQAIHSLASEGFFCSTALRSDPWLRPLSRMAGYQEVLDEVLGREADARALFQAAGGDRALP
jgi:DNA-binding winged helix-turn-helix (wHTH) protein